MPWKPFLLTRNPIVMASGHQTSDSKIIENHQGLDDQAARFGVYNIFKALHVLIKMSLGLCRFLESYCFHPWGPGCLGLPWELASMCFHFHTICGRLSVHRQGMGSSLHHFQGPFWSWFSGSFSDRFLQPLQPHPQRPLFHSWYKTEANNWKKRTGGKWDNRFRSFSTQMRRPSAN